MNFYERLLNKFGGSKQILKCIEEMNELTQVLLWELNDKGKQPKFIREKVIEEMSDVLMTFESLKLIYNISDKEIQDQINFKENKKIKELFSEDYIECMRCKKLTDIVLRVNPKGQDGIFWCEDCAEEKDITLDKVING